MTLGQPWCGRTPRAWQPAALSSTLSSWRSGTLNPLVHACTGAGKSLFIAEAAASGRGRVLITTPTQALVKQLSATVRARLPGEVGRCFQYAWEPSKRVVVTCNASLERLLAEQPEWGCWIADEAHRIEGDGLRICAERIQRKVAVGLTATPYRGDGRGLETWDVLVFSYPSGQAVRDGVLVPWRAVRWDGSGDADTDRVCEDWIRDARGPGIASAVTIADAEAFAQRLRDAGVPAESVHQRLSDGELDLRIRRLRSGVTRCLVHVQLLTEGVDLPWLRWLCLRRPVSSPVRLVQEVGRVLRVDEEDPTKTHATLYDPHDLLGELGLVHAAALEDAQRREAAEGEIEDAWSIPELEGLDEVSQLPPPRAVDALSGWVTDLLGQLRQHGLAEPPKFSENGKWRRKEATEKQRRALSGMQWAARYLPDPRHRRAVRWVLDQDSLRSGTASDLMDVLHALKRAGGEAERAKQRWAPPFEVPPIAVPAAEAA